MSLSLQHECVTLALDVAAKFGYLRKEFFFNYLTANSRSTKFRSWKILLTTGFFEAYKRSYIGDDVFKLSARGKKYLRLNGLNPVSAAHPLYFEHDDTVVNFVLSLRKKGLIKQNYLSEKVLRCEPANLIAERFGKSIEKLPDLVFDLEIKDHEFKVAFEVERTRKSKLRYDLWVQAYAKAQKINLVILAYNDHSVYQSIQSAIKAYQYPQNLRPIAFCKISEVQKNWTNFPIQINGRTIFFESYIENLKRVAQVPFNRPSDLQSEGESHLVGEVY